MDARNLLESLLDELPTLTEGEKLVLRTVVAINQQRQDQPPKRSQKAEPVKPDPLPPIGALRELHKWPYSLTLRELDVLQPLMEGLSSKEIGKILGISPRTVEVHRGHIMEKMGARSAVQLTTMIYRLVQN